MTHTKGKKRWNKGWSQKSSKKPTLRRGHLNAWTPQNMRNYLQSGTIEGVFYKTVFDWTESNLQDAIRRANEALGRAGIKPTETLSRIRLGKGTGQLTEGARKRLCAEADVITRSINTDETQTFFNDFPSITQKFFQYAREQEKADIKKEANLEATRSPHLTSQDQHQEEAVAVPPKTSAKRKRSLSSPSAAAKEPKSARKESPRLTSRLTSNGYGISEENSPSKPTFEEAEVHVGWVSQQEDGSFILEKGFRSLGTWFVSSESWQYDYEELRRSLRITTHSGLQVFWFEDKSQEPWVAKDDQAIAGAIERMHRKNDICFFVAADVEQVRALSVAQRAIEKQTSQVVALNLSTVEIYVRKEKKSHTNGVSTRTDSETTVRRPPKTPLPIPGISVSLARILGEQVMRSRVTFEER